MNNIYMQEVSRAVPRGMRMHRATLSWERQKLFYNTYNITSNEPPEFLNL